MYCVAVFGVGARFYIRIRIQRTFSLDDGILLFGLCCLTCAEGLLFVYWDDMYVVEALLMRPAQATFSMNFMDNAFAYQKWVTTSLVLLWMAVASVKFSFLFLFRKLIDRLRPLVIYWWVAVASNLVAVVLGISNYLLACPQYGAESGADHLRRLLGGGKLMARQSIAGMETACGGSCTSPSPKLSSILLAIS